MRKVIEKPNIVETYQIGNTTVHIADNYIRTDPAEIEQILEEYEAAGMAIAVSCYKRGVIV